MRAAKQRDNLTSLGLAKCGIGPAGAAEIAEYVRASAALTSLDVGDNGLDGSAKAQLRAAAGGRVQLEL